MSSLFAVTQPTSLPSDVPTMLVENEFVSVFWREPVPQSVIGEPATPFESTLVLSIRPKPYSSENEAGFRLDKIHFFEHSGTVGHGNKGDLWVVLKSQAKRSDFNKDACKLDPVHNKVLFQNERVRVVSVHFGPGESGPVVDKRPRVIILLDDMHAMVTLPDGHSEPRDGKGGMVYWGNAGAQATKNIGEKAFENIVVELKGK